MKSTDGSNIGDPVVSSLYGKIGSNEYGLFVTLGGFTAKARAFAQSKPNLRLVNGEELVKLILEYYERFDAKYKSLLPLRRVYIPAPADSLTRAGRREDPRPSGRLRGENLEWNVIIIMGAAERGRMRVCAVSRVAEPR